MASTGFEKPTVTKVLVETPTGENYIVNLGEPSSTSGGDPSSKETGIEPCVRPTIHHPGKGQSIRGLLHNWTLSQEEQEQLKDSHKIKHGVWEKEEKDQLDENIAKYCQDHGIKDPGQIIFSAEKEKRKDFYKTVAQGIDRPIFSVYRRVIRIYDPKNHLGKYSPQDLDRLRELRKQYGKDWQKIGLAMGRSAASIKDRCRYLKDNCNAGPWTTEEEELLYNALFEAAELLPGDSPTAGVHWAPIAKSVGSRSEKQCRRKWLSYTNNRRTNVVEWNEEDTVHLINKVQSESVDGTKVPWAELAQSWPRPSVRSHQWLHAKWTWLKSTVKDHARLSVQDICREISKQRNYNSAREDGLANQPDMANPPEQDSVSVELGSSSGVLNPSDQFDPVKVPVNRRTPGSKATPPTLVTNSNFVAGVAQEANASADHVTVVQLDFDGGSEEPITTDVMLSVGSLCHGPGSPLGLVVNKNDEDSKGRSRSRK